MASPTGKNVQSTTEPEIEVLGSSASENTTVLDNFQKQFALLSKDKRTEFLAAVNTFDDEEEGADFGQLLTKLDSIVGGELTQKFKEITIENKEPQEEPKITKSPTATKKGGSSILKRVQSKNLPKERIDLELGPDSGTSPLQRISSVRFAPHQNDDGDKDKKVKLNVGGVIYYTRIKTLTSELNTWFTKIQDELYDLEDGEEFFIDRNGQLFGYVLDFMRDKARVVLPPEPHKQQQLFNEAEHFNLRALAHIITRKTGSFFFWRITGGSKYVVDNGLGIHNTGDGPLRVETAFLPVTGISKSSFALRVNDRIVFGLTKAKNDEDKTESHWMRWRRPNLSSSSGVSVVSDKKRSLLTASIVYDANKSTVMFYLNGLLVGRFEDNTLAKKQWAIFFELARRDKILCLSKNE